MDRALGLDGSNGCVDVFGNHVAAVQHAAGHILAVARITFNHLVGRLERGVGDLSHAQLLVVGLLCRDDRSISGQRKVDTWIRHQVGLKLGKIDIEGAIEAKRCSDGADDLTDQTIEIGVGRAFNIQVATEKNNKLKVTQ